MNESFTRDIYLLSPGSLSPETIAVTFAKTSRSPLSFREIAAELTDEKSARFHEKWVVGYGHASVAEHAVLHIAFENVSRLAIESIESNRLASYTEKSTRYQRWEGGGYHTPEEVENTKYEETYKSVCDQLFATYLDSLEPVKRVIQSTMPRKEGESEKRWDNRIRSRYVDVCRFLLPAASLANVGMTANARTLENAIRKMLSHPLGEVRAIGRVVKEVSQEETPTLVKYADEVAYIRETERDFQTRSMAFQDDVGHPGLRLLSYDPEGEKKVLAAALYAHSNSPFESVLDHVRSLDESGIKELADSLLGRLSGFDVPLRALEHAVFTFDAVMDQGAYFELKRHRMMTQTPQPLTTKLSYTVPRLIEEAGFGDRYHEAMKIADKAYRELENLNPHVAAYLVPNGYNRRVLLTLNLREIFHFCELRSASNAHFSIRRVALQMAEKVQQVAPLLGSFIRLPEDVDWRQVEETNFSQV